MLFDKRKNLFGYLCVESNIYHLLYHLTNGFGSPSS